MGVRAEVRAHLRHSARAAMSGKWFNAVPYGVDPETHLIDFDQVARLAKEHKPTLIIAGGSAYPRIIDFAKFRAIADEVGATFMRSEEHTSELQSLMRISYAVFCLHKNTHTHTKTQNITLESKEHRDRP